MEEKFIKDMKNGNKNFAVKFIVLEVGKPTVTKEQNEVRSIKVADKTASINISVWGEPGTLLQPGDIVQLSKGYVSVFKNCLTLYVSKGADLQKTGEFCMQYNDQLDMSVQNLDLMPLNKPSSSSDNQKNNSLPRQSDSVRDPRLQKSGGNGGQMDPRASMDPRNKNKITSNGHNGPRNSYGAHKRSNHGPGNRGKKPHRD